jgi:arylsulfatase A-like enzyme
VSLVDLAPTILELAGATAPEVLDGRSLVPILRGRAASSERRSELLLELYNPELNAALRTDRWSYVELSRTVRFPDQPIRMSFRPPWHCRSR